MGWLAINYQHVSPSSNHWRLGYYFFLYFIRYWPLAHQANGNFLYKLHFKIIQVWSFKQKKAPTGPNIRFGSGCWTRFDSVPPTRPKHLGSELLQYPCCEATTGTGYDNGWIQNIRTSRPVQTSTHFVQTIIRNSNKHHCTVDVMKVGASDTSQYVFSPHHITSCQHTKPVEKEHN